jgi:hypothetical protein
MNDPLQALIQAVPLTAQLFGVNSRYHGSEAAVFVRDDGTPVPYIRRRFCPPPERFSTLVEHTVKQGERLDNITAQYLGDPEVFWRVCDANNVIAPEELEEVGRQIRITLPAGIP